MNKLLLAILIFASISCNCQNWFWSHNWNSNKPCTEGYGLLYNWFAATDIRKITSSNDWVIMTKTQMDDFITSIGGTTVAGGYLKEYGFTYWDSPNTDADNSLLFNARGTGIRLYPGGTFTSIKINSRIWTSTPASTSAYFLSISHNGANVGTALNMRKEHGASIRLLYIGSGTPTKYTGNDGKKYRVILISSQYWLADNLQETKFRNGDIIPFHGLDNTLNFTNAEWANLTTAGCCAYNSDVSNIGCNFLFPGD